MQKKQILYIALGLFLMLFLLFGGKAAKAIIQPLIAPAPAERHSKAKARNITLQANDYVLFGSYQGEPILWQVLRIQEGKPLLWSSRILCFKAFDAAGEDAALHRGADFAAQGSNRWADSSLRQWLNCVEQEVPWSHCPPAAQNVLDGLNPYADEPGFLAGFTAPFTALQLLWINIIMDGPPALTLGLEPIRGDLMNQRPTPRNASIVSGSMLSRIAINGVYMSIVFMAQHSLNFLGGSETELPTVLFTLFVVFQLFNALNSRELTDVSIFKNIANNRLMLGVFGATFGLQFVITQFGGMFFNTVPLSAAMWGKILATGSTVVLLSEGVKMVKRGAAAAQKSQGAEAVC